MLRKLKPCNLYRNVAGTTDYQEVWRYQKVLIEHAGQERKKGNSVPDSVILTQHPSLYTLGRGASLDNLRFSPNEPGWLRKGR
jgi:lipoyl(octanoyl) transferase